MKRLLLNLPTLPFAARCGAVCCLFSLVHNHQALAAPEFSFDAPTQGSHMASLAADPSGSVWVGMQDWAVWNRFVNPGGSTTWRQFTVKDGLGDNDAYAVAVDRRGRTWVGHLNHGVSVYNGTTWKNYNALTGPQGERIFDIAVSPKDGDVWIASDAGLSRYSDSQDKWSYFSRANGLPCDQINSISFDRSGDIYCGTPADGITFARAAHNYSGWNVVRANTQMPASAKGTGLPSNIVNDVLVAKGTADGEGAGFVYVGTVNGMAWSEDHGKTWQFVRGADWKANVLGRYRKVAPVNVPLDEDELLLQDWVTCLTEDRRGLVWVGHLRAGLEARDPRSMRTSFASPDKKLVSDDEDYIRAMLDVPGVGFLYGRYGNPSNPGVFLLGQSLHSGAGASSPTSPAVPVMGLIPSALPSPAAPLEASQLRALTARLKKLATPLKPGDASFLGDDWATQGDWVGRYGRGHATLAAMEGGSRESYTRLGTGMDHVLVGAPGYAVNAQNGPHDRTGMVPWITWANPDTRRALYDPLVGHRRHAEWTDLSNFLNTYPWEWDGPDLWVTVKVPAGVHRASLYFYNKDGQRGHDRYRDFPIELKRAPTGDPKFKEMPVDYRNELRRSRAVLSHVDLTPTLARTRVSDFWGSMYKQFALRGPGTFYFKVGRNHSNGVLVSGVFLDPVPNPNSPAKAPTALSWMNGVVYDAPVIEAKSGEPEALIAARELWHELDLALWKKGGAGVQRPMRLQALRAAIAAGASPSLIANWRWKLELWNDEEQTQWRETMERAFPKKIL